MDVQEILSIEAEAIRKTVTEYSTDNFITSYANQLIKLDYPKDAEKLKLITSRLIEWYNEEMPVINDTVYIHGKNAHQKSFDLLKQIYNGMKTKGSDF